MIYKYSNKNDALWVFYFMTTENLKLQEFGELGLITLNRPRALNALSLDMIIDMRLQLEKWSKTPHIKGVAICSSDPRAFCAGGDIRAVWEIAQSDPDRAATYFKEEYVLDRMIYHFPKPCLALVDGIWMGGGVGVAIHTKCTIVTENAVFAMPEAAIGFIPDVGTSRILAKLPANIGKLLAMTGLRLNAGDALGLKLAQNYVPHKAIPEVIDWLKQGVNWRQPLHTQIKHRWCEFPPELSQFDGSLKRKIRNLFQADNAPEIAIALEKSHWEQAQYWRKLMARNSPQAMALAVEAQKRAKSYSFDEAIAMESAIAEQLIHQQSDMIEGIRALIIDKDKNPQWSPPSLESIDLNKIHHFFDPV